MDVVVLIGRTLFVAIFLASGIGHFGQTEGMAGYAEMRGVKPARPFVLLSGTQIIVGGSMVLLGVWADLGALLLGAFALEAAFLIHHFWTDEGQEARNQQAHFMKNIALAGAALTMFVFFAVAGPDLGLQITEPLFNLTI